MRQDRANRAAQRPWVHRLLALLLVEARIPAAVAVHPILPPQGHALWSIQTLVERPGFEARRGHLEVASVEAARSVCIQHVKLHQEGLDIALSTVQEIEQGTGRLNARIGLSLRLWGGAA